MARRILVLVSLCLFAAAPVSAQEPVRVGVLTIRSGPIASCGRQMEEGLQFALKERGGKIVQKPRPPIVTPDYGPYIAQLKTSVDAIYAGFGPTNGQRFLKQYAEFGMKLPVLGMVTTTEESSLKSMGDEALGVITAGTYSAAIDTPTNRKWVQAMRAEYKDDPGYCTIGGT